MYIKEFDKWNQLKRRLNNAVDVPFFKEGEIWWASIGVNVGHEEDGKNEAFSRPILITKKFNSRLFWGVPLTTQIKENPHYYPFRFKDRMQCALLTQMRLWDANRLTRRMGKIGKADLSSIKQRLIEYLK